MSDSEDEYVSFDEFVRARRRALLRTAYLLTGQHADAEDLVQAALIKAVPHWRRIADNPEPYVRRILARESVSRWRRRRWREIASEDLPEVVSEDPDVASREDLRRALLSLAPRQRAVIVLRYFEDLTEAETAEALHIAVGTVKSQTRDALKVLRLRLPSLEGGAAHPVAVRAAVPSGTRAAPRRGVSRREARGPGR